MVHPRVLAGCGKIDPDEYQGFAFGMGIERIAMLQNTGYPICDLSMIVIFGGSSTTVSFLSKSQPFPRVLINEIHLVMVERSS